MCIVPCTSKHLTCTSCGQGSAAGLLSHVGRKNLRPTCFQMASNTLRKATAMRRCNHVSMPCWNESTRINNSSQGAKLHAQNLTYTKTCQNSKWHTTCDKHIPKFDLLIPCISKHLTCTSCGQGSAASLLSHVGLKNLRPTCLQMASNAFRKATAMRRCKHIEKSDCNATLQPC